MRRPRLRRTKKFVRNVRAVWQFLKPQVHIYARKPRFTRLGFQWTWVDKAGITRRTKSKEHTRRVRLVRMFLNRYGIPYRKFHREEEKVKRDRYRLKGWSVHRQKVRPSWVQYVGIEFTDRDNPFLKPIKSDKHEREAWKKHPHREARIDPERIHNPTLKAAYSVDALDCLDVEFHSQQCPCPECFPVTKVVGDPQFADGEVNMPAPRKRKSRKKPE